MRRLRSVAPQPGSLNLAGALRWAALLVGAAALLTTIPGAGLRGALASEVILNNGSLVVQNATCTLGLAQLVALAATQFATATSYPGLVARSEYAQAYLCLDGVTLCNGLDVLESFATIEANNSYLLVPGGKSPVYESLELVLVQNNTLALISGGNVTFLRSTISLGSDNWFYVANDTLLQLTNSRFNFSDYVGWSVLGSTLVAQQSILEFKDVVMLANSSRIGLVNSTWYAHSAGLPPPLLYEGKVKPLVWFANSDITLQGTLAIFSNYSGIFTNTSLLLVNSTLQLYNTTLELWASPLGLINSRVELYNDSAIAFYCGSYAVFEGVVANATFSIPANQRLGPPAGFSLGAVDAAVVAEPNGTIITVPPLPTTMG